MKYQVMVQCKHSSGKIGTFLKSGDWEGTCYDDLVELSKSGLYQEVKNNKEIKWF